MTTEPQESASLKVDLVDVVKKRGIQHHQGEDNVLFVERIVKYVWKLVNYEQDIFNAEIVQFTNIFNMIISQLSLVEINFED